MGKILTIEERYELLKWADSFKRAQTIGIWAPDFKVPQAIGGTGIEELLGSRENRPEWEGSRANPHRCPPALVCDSHED